MIFQPIQLMIVGAQKSGTTSLFQFLSQHPNIHSHQQQELSFFLNDLEYNQEYHKAFSRYFGYLPSNKILVFAKHVMAMYSNTAIERIYKHNPYIHLVVVLRNPVERAYSAYWYARRMGWEGIQTFEEALEMETTRINKGWLQNRNFAYLFNGTYYLHIDRLFNIFERDQVHIFLLDELRDNPIGVCQKIFGIFDINSDFVPNVNRYFNKSKAARSEILARSLAWFFKFNNPARRLVRQFIPDAASHKLRYSLLSLNEKDFTPPPMKSATKDRLVCFFKPYNEKLSGLLNLNVSHWDY